MGPSWPCSRRLAHSCADAWPAPTIRMRVMPWDGWRTCPLLSPRSARNLDHAGRDRIAVEPLDQRVPALQRRSLVDVALVRELVAVDRGRLGHQQDAPDLHARARLAGVVFR